MVVLSGVKCWILDDEQVLDNLCILQIKSDYCTQTCVPFNINLNGFYCKYKTTVPTAMHAHNVRNTMFGCAPNA